jgi:hypothetical protein
VPGELDSISEIAGLYIGDLNTIFTKESNMYHEQNLEKMEIFCKNTEVSEIFQIQK